MFAISSQDRELTSISQIRAKRDLRMLCLVCSTFRTLAIPNLYHSIELTTEEAVLSPIDIKSLLAARNDGVHFIKHLRVFGDWNYPEAMSLFGSSQRMRLVNVMVLLLLQRIGKDQLRSFEWLIPSLMSPELMNHLQTHHPNLRKVSWKHQAAGASLRDANLMQLPQLTTLSAQNISTADQMDYVQRWIASCTSLRKLEISTVWETPKPQTGKVQETNHSPVKSFFRSIIERSERKHRRSKVDMIRGRAELVHSSRASKLSIVSSEDGGVSLDGGVGRDDVSSIAERMEEAIDPHHPFDFRLQLDSLKLADFPFLNSAPQLCSAINLSQLSSLTLQACARTSSLLDSWRLTSAINLKKLHLLLAAPLEDPASGPHSVACVNRFLGAFSGLESFVLLSRVHSRHPMDELSCHSSTLKRLVLDLKTSACAHLCIKRDRLIELYRSYRCLTELAVSVLFSNSIFLQLGLLAKQLSTLRILNTRRTNNDAASRLADATMIASPAVAVGAAAPLRILCMATTTATDGHSEPIPEMEIGGDYKWGSRRKEFFYVQRAVNILGNSVPILTKINVEKAMELEGGKIKVLKVGWGVWGFR